MKTYEVSIKRIEYGWCKVIAENEQEAKELALESNHIRWVNETMPTEEMTVKEI